MGRMYAKVFEDAARRRTDMKRLTFEGIFVISLCAARFRADHFVWTEPAHSERSGDS